MTTNRSTTDREGPGPSKGGSGPSKTGGYGSSSNKKISGSTGTSGGPTPGPASLSNLSFYIKIEPLKPNYDVQPIRHQNTLWYPPTRCNAFLADDGPVVFCRWHGGRIVASDPTVRNMRPETLRGYIYRTATIFTQHDNTDFLLAVNFDVRTANVPENNNGWRSISFNHQPVPNSSNRYYSYVSAVGAERRIAAPGGKHSIPQLLPGTYDCLPPPNGAANQRVHAGLIGCLPLLFALAAFSAPPHAINTVLQAVRPRAWRSHQYHWPEGHKGERGMVVTIYLDPMNGSHSTVDLLNRLQNGEFGAFYGPEPYNG